MGDGMTGDSDRGRCCAPAMNSFFLDEQIFALGPKTMTPDFSAQFRPRYVWDSDTMLQDWWWAMYRPWTVVSDWMSWPSAPPALTGRELPIWSGSWLDERTDIARWWP
jgi:hypothetical protein